MPPDGTLRASIPVLGRIALAPDLAGAGERRGRPTTTASPPTWAAASTSARATLDAAGTAGPAGARTTTPTIQAALAALGGDGVVEITDSGRYEETLAVAVQADGHVICAPPSSAGRRSCSAAS